MFQCLKKSKYANIMTKGPSVGFCNFSNVNCWKMRNSSENNWNACLLYTQLKPKYMQYQLWIIRLCLMFNWFVQWEKEQLFNISPKIPWFGSHAQSPIFFTINIWYPLINKELKYGLITGTLRYIYIFIKIKKYIPSA